jgi:hypothetical protein
MRKHGARNEGLAREILVSEESDGIAGYWCIDGLDLEFAPPLRGGADDNPHFTRPDLSAASLFS